MTKRLRQILFHIKRTKGPRAVLSVRVRKDGSIVVNLRSEKHIYYYGK